MAFSPVPAFYYSLYCEPITAAIIIGVNIAAGLLSFVLSLSDWFHREEHKKIKIGIFSTSSIASLIGLFHLVIR